jgi:hypothetical protein
MGRLDVAVGIEIGGIDQLEDLFRRLGRPGTAFLEPFDDLARAYRGRGADIVDLVRADRQVALESLDAAIGRLRTLRAEAVRRCARLPSAWP